MNAASSPSVASDALALLIADEIRRHDGWIGFEHFMALALYQPGLGYYSGGDRQFGALPASGSDFVTAPELCGLFGRAVARQLAQALDATGTAELWEFGAGSGALAAQLLDTLQTLGVQVRRYTIVDLSGSLRARQQLALARFGDTVRWVDALPAQFDGVVVGNEVLDAMPVQLLARVQGQWHERGVAWHADAFAWADRPTDLRPPLDIPGPHDYLTEIHPQAQAFIRTLAASLGRGAVFLLDYGFGESEYYHPQRHMGTVMCHQAHQADSDPLVQVGAKDITAHVDFTGIALAAQDDVAAGQPGFSVLGYTTQAHFLMNCGLLSNMEQSTKADSALALKLIHEHEMGEFFKVIGLCKGEPWDALGFSHGDRSHRL